MDRHAGLDIGLGCGWMDILVHPSSLGGHLCIKNLLPIFFSTCSGFWVTSVMPTYHT